MNSYDPTLSSARGLGWRRLAVAALVAAGAMSLGAGAFGHTAIAKAEWDIEAYDECVRIGTDEVACCRLSGGQIGDKGVCVAPPARILQNIPGLPLHPKLGQPGRPPVLPPGTVGTPTAAKNLR